MIHCNVQAQYSLIELLHDANFEVFNYFKAFTDTDTTESLPLNP